jgi:hypothetical protein
MDIHPKLHHRMGHPALAGDKKMKAIDLLKKALQDMGVDGLH